MDRESWNILKYVCSRQTLERKILTSFDNYALLLGILVATLQGFQDRVLTGIGGCPFFRGPQENTNKKPRQLEM